MRVEPLHAETDVLVIGSGAAGMYAAIEAARRGCHVLLADRSLIGRGGATVMAQMTVAVALGEETPDDWHHHYDDTIAAGRGLCNEALARLLCEEAPECIRELDAWGVGWALVDMEFVQFFPIGHLAPRLIGMDPIMWDPFRYKLGGRLLNGRMEEFTSRYGSDEDGKYVLTRDLATYAIFKEVEAGRGSPHGGAYLSFQHCPEEALRGAFGPVIDRL